MAAALVAATAAAHLGATFYLARHDVFDDAYISFRYARNLAEGYGLTWNPGEAPVEGYTNFLLIVILAPFIRLGCDPLTCVRALSAIAAVGLASLVGNDVRGRNGDVWTVLFCASLFLLAGPTAITCTSGLETMIFAAALYACVRPGLAAMDPQHGARPSWRFGLMLGGCALLRPEAVLLGIAWAIVLVMEDGRRGLQRLARAVAGSALVLGPYLTWKLLYFGTVVPNPAYLKMSGTGAVSYKGLVSIEAALARWLPVACTALIGAAHAAHDRGDLETTRRRRIACVMLLVYCAFILRVDTLMDIHSRFLFPVSSFLYVLAGPSLARVHDSISARPGFGGLCRALAGASACAVLFFDGGLHQIEIEFGALAHGGRPPDPSSLMQRELTLAHALAEFPGIERTSIAFADAGVIPYFTRATFIDTVGLTDREIARAPSAMDAARYVLGRRPTMLLVATHANGSLITFGHGPLGDLTRWVGDPTLPWRDYVYAGTVRSSVYDIQFLVRRDWPHSAELIAFLQQRVVDGTAWDAAFLR